MLSKSANERFASLQLNYARTLGDKLEQLRVAWERCLHGGWAESAGEDLRMQVHRVAGSAPSYGFSEIGEAARSLELCLKEHAETDNGSIFPGPGSEHHFSLLCRLLAKEKRLHTSTENGESLPPV